MVNEHTALSPLSHSATEHARVPLRSARTASPACAPVAPRNSADKSDRTQFRRRAKFSRGFMMDLRILSSPREFWQNQIAREIELPCHFELLVDFAGPPRAGPSDSGFGQNSRHQEVGVYSMVTYAPALLISC